MRHAKAVMRLKNVGLEHEIELRPRAQDHGVLLELVRADCYEGPLVSLPLDEAQAFLRTLQGAVDEAYRRAKLEHKVTQTLARKESHHG